MLTAICMICQRMRLPQPYVDIALLFYLPSATYSSRRLIGDISSSLTLCGLCMQCCDMVMRVAKSWTWTCTCMRYFERYVKLHDSVAVCCRATLVEHPES